MPCHHMQHARNVGPILFMCNENIALVMPCVTTCAVTSCVHCAVHARRQAGHSNYMWHTRNYLWMCRLCRPNDIFIITNHLTFYHPKYKLANQNVLKRILIAMLTENKADWNENFRICAVEPVAPLYKQ